MNVITHLRRIVARHLSQLSWLGILVVVGGYVLLSWALLLMADEQALTTNLTDFVYWLVVTSSTVGYGDVSPTTSAGKWVVSFYVIPTGLAIFAMIVGRIAVFSANQWKKGIRGLKMINVSNHLLVLGWNGQRSMQLLKLLVSGSRSNRNRSIVLCVTDTIDNPLPDDIEFVRTSSYTNDADLDRACISDASCIIIDNELDDVTLSTALYAYGRNKSANILVYFKDEALSGILKQHCPSVESMPSIAVEMLAKSAMDPGSSALHQELLNAADGMTQYSARYPDEAESLAVEHLFDWLKRVEDATLIGVRGREQSSIVLNPPLKHQILPGDTLYYIAKNRLSSVVFQQAIIDLARSYV